MEYCSCKPYPKIEVERENIEYAKILLEDYAGENGEDTAIHTYFYQSLVVEEEKEILEGISKVEMHHLEILGKLIYQLGYLPSFYTVDSNIECVIPWTSKNVNYATNFSTILLDNIAREMKAIKTYQKHIQEINDPYIKKILERIIEDEEVHIHCFEQIYHNHFGKICE